MTLQPGETPNAVDSHSQKGIQLRIQQQAAIIRNWATEQNFVEGQDYLIIEDITDHLEEGDEGWPHERRMFYMAIRDTLYARFREFFTTDYVTKVQAFDPKAQSSLDFSHSGRFCVGWAGVPCDTIPVHSLDPLVIQTHHSDFRTFFHEETGFELPTAEDLNATLTDIAKKALPLYKRVQTALRGDRDDGVQRLGENEYYRAMNEFGMAIEVLERAEKGDAAEDFPETIEGPMSSRRLFTYADLTYNAEDRSDFGAVAAQFGVTLPSEHCLDQILEQEGGKIGKEFDHRDMERICKEFALKIYPRPE